MFQMDIDDEMSEVLYSKLLELEEEVRCKQRGERRENSGREAGSQSGGKTTYF